MAYKNLNTSIDNMKVNKPIKIALIGGSGDVGGYVSFVDELIYRLGVESSFKFAIYKESRSSLNKEDLSSNIRMIRIPRKNKLDLIGNLTKSLNDAIDNEHVNIIYLLGYVSSPFINKSKIKKNQITLMINPDGMEWQRRKYGLVKKLYFYLAEIRAAYIADYLVVDSKEIGFYFKKKYGRESIFIPYGYDSKWKIKPFDLTSMGIRENDYYLVIGRCVPENNLIEIIKGFSRSRTSKSLLIVTNLDRDKFSKKLIDLARNDRRIILHGPIYNKGILYYLREKAFCYIHGHSVGGTNPSLVEAMGCGNIILAHKNIYNLEVLGEELGYYFSSPEELEKAIETIEKIDPRQLYIRRSKIKQRANDLYNWEYIVERYRQLFMTAGAEI